jgi:hypothetical protein
MVWYYEADNRPRGPVESAEMIRLIDRGLVRRKTRIWREGMPGWQPAGGTELFGVRDGATSPPTFPAASASSLWEERARGQWTSSEARSDADVPSFFRTFAGAFAYPLMPGAVPLLVIGALFFWVIGFLGRLPYGWLFGIFGAGYLAATMMKIVNHTANGRDDMPAWPGIADGWNGILRPSLILTLAGLLSFLPVAVAAFAHWRFGIAHPAAYIVLGLLAFLSIPMSVLSVSLHDGLSGANPVTIWTAVFRTFPAYLLLLFTLAGIAVSQAVMQSGLALIPWRFAASLLNGLIGFYFLIVQMRLLGLLFRSYEHRLGWFDY